MRFKKKATAPTLTHDLPLAVGDSVFRAAPDEIALSAVPSLPVEGSAQESSPTGVLALAAPAPAAFQDSLDDPNPCFAYSTEQALAGAALARHAGLEQFVSREASDRYFAPGDTPGAWLQAGSATVVDFSAVTGLSAADMHLPDFDSVDIFEALAHEVGFRPASRTLPAGDDQPLVLLPRVVSPVAGVPAEPVEETAVPADPSPVVDEDEGLVAEETVLTSVDEVVDDEPVWQDVVAEDEGAEGQFFPTPSFPEVEYLAAPVADEAADVSADTPVAEPVWQEVVMPEGSGLDEAALNTLLSELSEFSLPVPPPMPPMQDTDPS